VARRQPLLRTVWEQLFQGHDGYSHLAHEGLRGGRGFGMERSMVFIETPFPLRSSWSARWRIRSIASSGSVFDGESTLRSRSRRRISLSLVHK
jgi:hypothetical protein